MEKLTKDIRLVRRCIVFAIIYTCLQEYNGICRKPCKKRGESMLKKMFSLSINKNRREFLGSQIGFGITSGLIYKCISFYESKNDYALTIVFLIFFLIILWGYLVGIKQRLNDLLLSWKWIFLIVVPFVNYLFILFLLFKPNNKVELAETNWNNEHYNH
jgi:uncharacterized membrane protein YhaH (DUF805 family)